METHGRRKTPERYAILDAIYGFNGHFTLQELGEKLEKSNFHVSRATLYNSMKLFAELRLVVRHNIIGGTKYEAVCGHDNHVHQICLVCGKVTELKDNKLTEALAALRTPKFKKEGYAIYIYGICSSCQTKMAKKSRRGAGK